MVSAAASASDLTASVSGGVNLPGIDGFASATARSELSGSFLVDGPGLVDVQFLAAINYFLSVLTDLAGLSANSEIAFTLDLDNGDQPLFLDIILPLNGPGTSDATSFSGTLSNHDLLAPGQYQFTLGLDYEPRGTDSSVPEPSTIFLAIAGAAMLLAMRRPRASLCRAVSRSWRSWMPLVLLIAILGSTARAKDQAANQPLHICPTCNCSPTCPAPQTRADSDAGTSLSLAEADLIETVDVSRTSSAFGVTMPFQVTYNSYDADGSRAQIDSTMGYGWTHSSNTFLFSQLGSMFRYDSSGRITKYKLGPGGTFTAATGYFETLVKNPDGSFTITQKDQTKFTFALVPGTHFLVNGPVWRLTDILTRTGDHTTLNYTAGNLTDVIDTYGRDMKLTLQRPEQARYDCQPGWPRNDVPVRLHRPQAHRDS
jgi:hypothetical protein